MMLKKNTSGPSGRLSSRMCSVTCSEVWPWVKRNRPEAGVKSSPLAAVAPNVWYVTHTLRRLPKERSIVTLTCRNHNDAGLLLRWGCQCRLCYRGDLTVPSSSRSQTSCWAKEKTPKGLSLAAIVILACLEMWLISSPGVADVSVSRKSRRSSGRSSSLA